MRSKLIFFSNTFQPLQISQSKNKTFKYWFTLLPTTKFLTFSLIMLSLKTIEKFLGLKATIPETGKDDSRKRRNVIVHSKICLQVLRDNTVQWYGWSFYLAWLGVATCLGTMTLFLIAATCLRREHAREQAQNIQYIMPGDAQTLKRPY